MRADRVVATLADLRGQWPDLTGTAVVGLDLRELPLDPAVATAEGAMFLGCTVPSGLAEALTAKGATVQTVQTGASPTDAQVASAVRAAADKDVVVVTTMKAWDTSVTDPRGGQQKLVKQLLGTGRTVVVVAVRDPYDIACFTAAPTYVATYSYSPVAIEAAARVIVGDVSPTATLPVDIPVAGDPNTVLYPFGHGLTY